MEYEMLKLKCKKLEKLTEVQSLQIEALQNELSKVIRYCDYLAYNLDKSISYSEYIANATDNLYDHFPEARVRKDFRDLFYGE
ncbi:MAG: hypothetical protein JSS79_05210 [Bacteroidetes bacterium]|nr:hypothetical protein [Bacteroidota bacterium]